MADQKLSALALLAQGSLAPTTDLIYVVDVSAGTAGSLAMTASTFVLGTIAALTLGVGAGSAAAPSYSFTGDPDTGWFNRIGNVLDASVAGVVSLDIQSTAITMRSGQNLAWSGTDDASAGPDLRLYREAAATLAQRDGANAQSFRIYNTYTDASNYERGGVWWSSNVLNIGVDAQAGTGSGRSLRLHSREGAIQFAHAGMVFWRFNLGLGSRALTPDTTNVYDIGTASLTVRDIYTGRTLHGAGTAALPAVSFASDANTGIYSVSSDNLGFAVAGVLAMQITSTGIQTTGALTLGTALGVANGGTGQATALLGFDALKQAATEIYSGVVELATTAEAVAGVDTSRSVTCAGLAAALAASPGSTIEPGTIFDYAATAVPAGYLDCDGANVSRSTYSALFAAISTTWGVGDGSTTFGLPDLRRRTTVGAGGTGTATLGNAVGDTGGAETHALVTAELASHTHGAGSYVIAGRNTGSGSGASLAAGTTSSRAVTGTSSSTGSGTAHNNMQPSAVMRKIIKT